MFRVALKLNVAKKLRVKLAKFKVECKKALEKNELRVYDNVIAKGKVLPFEIYEYTLCNKRKELLLNSMPYQEQKKENFSIKQASMSNSKIVGNCINKYRTN
jgi:hypothetical protein